MSADGVLREVASHKQKMAGPQIVLRAEASWSTPTLGRWGGSLPTTSLRYWCPTTAGASYLVRGRHRHLRAHAYHPHRGQRPVPCTAAAPAHGGARDPRAGSDRRQCRQRRGSENRHLCVGRRAGALDLGDHVSPNPVPYWHDLTKPDSLVRCQKSEYTRWWCWPCGQNS